jgi:hypothetical protein
MVDALNVTSSVQDAGRGKGKPIVIQWEPAASGWPFVDGSTVFFAF